MKIIGRLVLKITLSCHRTFMLYTMNLVYTTNVKFQPGGLSGAAAVLFAL